MHSTFISFIFILSSLWVFAQNDIRVSDTIQIKKDVKMTIENGQKVLTIETTEYKNGKETLTKEVFIGEKADQKLEELKKEQLISENEQDLKSEIWDDVRFEEVDGYKKLTIIHNENGSVTEKVFIGEEAEKKLQELQDKKE